jgi:dimeric dUTPase (all-alpha-NTP-PPase superfamily)
MTKDEFRNILVAQDELNKKYSGERWKETVSDKKFKSAIFTEIAEYLESSPEDWKWWKNLKNDRQNQYIEVIDVVHFATSLMLKYNTIDELVDQFDLNQMKRTYSLRTKKTDLFKAINEFFEYPNTDTFLFLIFSMTIFTKDLLVIQEVWEGYFEKNKLNHIRIEGGYKEGKYEKINENGEEDNRQIKFKG